MQKRNGSVSEAYPYASAERVGPFRFNKQYYDEKNINGFGYGCSDPLMRSEAITAAA